MKKKNRGGEPKQVNGLAVSRAGIATSGTDRGGPIPAYRARRRAGTRIASAAAS